MRGIPPKVVVLVDSREQYPMLFPKFLTWYRGTGGRPILLPVVVKVERLEFGDYALDAYRKACVVERKGSAAELAGNLMTKDWERQRKSFEKLSRGCRVPVLWFDGGLGDLMKHVHSQTFSQKATMPDPAGVVDRLIQVCTHYRLKLWMVGGARTAASRTEAGGLMLRLMLGYGLGKEWMKEDRRRLEEAAKAEKQLQQNENRRDFLETRRARCGKVDE